MNGPSGEGYLMVEVEDDRFAEPVQRRFKCVGAPIRVSAVDLDGDGPQRVRGLEVVRGEVVVGPAFACAVEDSGSGIVWLVYGGAAGVWVGEGAAPRVGEGVFEAFLLVDRSALTEG